jgi:DNA polymerase-3 subunit delta'
MNFKDVLGQTEVKAHLVDIVRSNRLSHALLFLGKEGSGALPLALAFAQYIVCEKTGNRTSNQGASLFSDAGTVQESPDDACGKCSACLKAKQLVHLDIHFSYPVIPKKPGEKPISIDYASEWREFIHQLPYGNVYDWLQFIGAENKQGNITAEECNDIIRKLSIKSFESDYKILVLWMAEYLGKEGNKLLKLIEEPPANTIFILVAENESQILQTIISRTQLIKVPALEDAEITQALVNRGGVNPDQARQLASVSEGNYREALQLLNHAGEDWQALLRDWLNATVKKKHITQVKWIEEISKIGRENQKQFLRYCNHMLSQSIRLQVIGGAGMKISENEIDFAIRLNKLVSIPQQEAIIEEFDKAAYYIERNANPKMLFHALTIRLHHIITDKSLILVA